MPFRNTAGGFSARFFCDCTVTATLFKRKSEVLEPLKSQHVDIQRFIKMAHNSRFFDQATTWLRKIDSQTTICKMSLLYLTDVHHVLCRVRVGMVRGRPHPERQKMKTGEGYDAVV